MQGTGSMVALEINGVICGVMQSPRALLKSQTRCIIFLDIQMASPICIHYSRLFVVTKVLGRCHALLWSGTVNIAYVAAIAVASWSRRQKNFDVATYIVVADPFYWL